MRPRRIVLALTVAAAVALTVAGNRRPAWAVQGTEGSAELRGYLLKGVSRVRRGRELLGVEESVGEVRQGVFQGFDEGALLGRHPHVFATVACHGNMAPGVAVLHESLVREGHREPLVVVVAKAVEREVRTELATMPLVKVLAADGGHGGFCDGGVRVLQDGQIDDGCAHLKILLFGLLSAQKVVFLEYDSVVMKNLQVLADHPPFSAVREPHVGLFESSVMVLKPDHVVYDLLRREYCKRAEDPENARGSLERDAETRIATDHDVIRTTVPDEAWTVISDTFNVPQDHMDALWYRRVDTDPHVIHFKGETKPWNWWRLGKGEPMSMISFTRWCDAAKTTPFACDEPEGNDMIAPMNPKAWSDKKRLTVLLSTYRRPTWRDLTKHYCSMNIVARVIVVWHDPEGDPPLAAQLGLKVTVWQPKTNSLNNRFVAPGNLTECVYVCDDDMKVNELQLQRGFNVWKTHSRRLVGYFPRRWMTDSPYYSARVHDGYNIVLTKGLFTHRFFLYQYTHLFPTRIKAIVDDFNNCEDILFNMMVSGYSGIAPMHVLVEGEILDLGHGGGISASGKHFSTRFKCVHRLLTETGITDAPLMSGSLSSKPLKNREKI